MRQLLTITFTVYSFLLYVIILSFLFRNSINKRKRLNAINDKQKIEMYAELENSFRERFVMPALKAMRAALLRLAIKKKKQGDESNQEIKKLLRHAGINITPEEYSSVRMAFIIAVIGITVLVVVFVPMSFELVSLAVLFGSVLSFLMPSYYIKSRAKKRQNLILQQLPEVMDLLGISMEAGLGFDAALMKISDIMSGPLIYELVLLHREIQMGRPRKLALKDFGDCCNLPEVKIFASSLIQAEQLGIPIKNVMATQSAQMRTSRRQRAQEKGMKAPVKIMIPMVLCIFPVIFIILLGPTIIQLIKQFA